MRLSGLGEVPRGAGEVSSTRAHRVNMEPMKPGREARSLGDDQDVITFLRKGHRAHRAAILDVEHGCRLLPFLRLCGRNLPRQRRRYK